MSNDIKKTRLVAAVWCFKPCSEYLIVMISVVLLAKTVITCSDLAKNND